MKTTKEEVVKCKDPIDDDENGKFKDRSTSASVEDSQLVHLVPERLVVL
jgi:hypothetical protein